MIRGSVGNKGIYSHIYIYLYANIQEYAYLCIYIYYIEVIQGLYSLIPY